MGCKTSTCSLSRFTSSRGILAVSKISLSGIAHSWIHCMTTAKFPRKARSLLMMACQAALLLGACRTPRCSSVVFETTSSMVGVGGRVQRPLSSVLTTGMLLLLLLLLLRRRRRRRCTLLRLHHCRTTVPRHWCHDCKAVVHRLPGLVVRPAAAYAVHGPVVAEDGLDHGLRLFTEASRVLGSLRPDGVMVDAAVGTLPHHVHATGGAEAILACFSFSASSACFLSSAALAAAAAVAFAFCSAMYHSGMIGLPCLFSSKGPPLSTSKGLSSHFCLIASDSASMRSRALLLFLDDLRFVLSFAEAWSDWLAFAVSACFFSCAFLASYSSHGFLLLLENLLLLLMLLLRLAKYGKDDDAEEIDDAAQEVDDDVEEVDELFAESDSIADQTRVDQTRIVWLIRAEKVPEQRKVVEPAWEEGVVNMATSVDERERVENTELSPLIVHNEEDVCKTDEKKEREDSLVAVLHDGDVLDDLLKHCEMCSSVISSTDDGTVLDELFFNNQRRSKRKLLSRQVTQRTDAWRYCLNAPQSILHQSLFNLLRI
ncbi:hypothetical protein KC339_g32 [Hortaea werneckii]|nr:hypothetical protein KC339_g32 [Hortaea werneckii]